MYQLYKKFMKLFTVNQLKVKKKNEDYFVQTHREFLHKKINSQKQATVHTIFVVLLGALLGFFTAVWLRSNILSCSNNRQCCPNNALLDQILRERSLEQTSENIKIFTEIEPQKSLVFIGVMTAQKYLDTRARAVYETWAKNIPGKISFFSRAGSSSNYNIPLVSLPGVDDSYPPQKKSFMMLKFIHDNYIDKFEWFMRVDDDIYIKPDKLESFLRTLNSSVPQFIGQAGLGNKDEFGQLSLDYDENFCMGGPGMLMSRETLRRVVPHISYCLKNLYSTHEDVEVGRCVRKFANISCTWTYEIQHIFHHNNNGTDGFAGNLLTSSNLQATTLHPIKKPNYLYRLHNFINQRRIFDLRYKFFNLEREIFRLKNQLSNLTSLPDSSFNKLIKDFKSIIDDRFLKEYSLNDAKNPTKRLDRSNYDFFTRSLFSSTYISPKRRLEGYWQQSIVENLRQIMDKINHDSISKGRLIDYKDTLYGYVRNHPLVGLDYILDILLIYKKYEGRKMTVPVRRHAYVRNSFTSMLFREDPLDMSLFIHLPEKYRQSEEKRPEILSSTDSNGFLERILGFFSPALELNSIRAQNTMQQEKADLIEEATRLKVIDHIKKKIVNFVVPLAGRWEIFERFIKNYEKVCLAGREKTRLVVVLFENDSSKLVDGSKQSGMIKKVFEDLRKKYELSEDEKALSLIVNEDNFSRSIGCEMGASLFGLHELIFFVDVDIAFTADFLLRARLNTIEYRQVYYPIVFSEYNPGRPKDSLRIKDDMNGGVNNEQVIRNDHYDFHINSGYWRSFGFGILSTYNSDLHRVGGFDKSIVGWGKEDVDLYEKFINSNLTNFRAVDPGLVHIFHKIECDSKLNEEQMIMCIGSKSTSIASQQLLSNLVYNEFSYLINQTQLRK